MMLILASSSAHRLKLIKNAGVVPDRIISPDIDETPLKKEKPHQLAARLSLLKAQKVIEATEANNCNGSIFVIAADTVVGTKARIFEKAENPDDIKNNLHFFSGKKISIFSSVTVGKKTISGEYAYASRLVKSYVKFKRLSSLEIEHYLSTGMGNNIAGGVEIQGYGEALIKNISGSYSGIIGLPLYETFNLLHGLGYELYKSKSKN